MSKKSTNPEILRHSTAHVLACAVLNLFPDTKYAIGPATSQGFYYDFKFLKPLTSEDLPAIEKEMRRIINKGYEFKKQEVSAKKAREFFEKDEQLYKVALLDRIAKKENPEKVNLYEVADFIDLCHGPHLPSTQEIPADAIKLTGISGAYWEGDEKKEMLQRIYGVVFERKKELGEYLKNIEEAKKRDHRKLGKELDLFVFSNLVGPGLPLFTPKGTIIIEELKKRVEEICRKYGFEKVMTPHLAKIDLYEISGHADKFSQELFHVTSRHKQDYVLKPVQCPHQIQIYANKPRSYQDLPIRYMESEKQYRAEKPGEIGGLNRVIAITVEDGHSFCRVDQVKEEIKNMVNIISNFYKSLGLWKDHWVSLSVRDYAHPEKYIGDTKDWDFCEKILQEISDEMGLDAKKQEGEAALYGPKLDFMFKDALGKEIQIPTVQLDFATPKRFLLFYINKEGKKVPPVMVHRAILGSYERLLAILIEHFAGAFPVWLSPVQVIVIPVSEKFNKYGEKVVQELKKVNVRVEFDDSSESLGKKISIAQKQKTPYMLIVGEREEGTKEVALRSRSKGDEGAMPLLNFVCKIKKEIEERIVN